MKFIWTFLLVSSCAQLHHVQVGEIDNSSKYALRPIEIKVSETGVNFEEAGRIVQSLNSSSVGRRDVGGVTGLIALFQMGPKTGNPTFSESYAKNLVNDLYKDCPSGKLTGLVSIRETRKYPVISGEIIKIKGYCMLPRTSANTQGTKRTKMKKGK